MKTIWYWFNIFSGSLGILTAIAAPFVMRPMANAILWMLVVTPLSIRIIRDRNVEF